jgi:hypothetical protein
LRINLFEKTDFWLGITVAQANSSRVGTPPLELLRAAATPDQGQRVTARHLVA